MFGSHTKTLTWCGTWRLLTLDDLKYALGEKLVSSEDLTLFGSEAGILKIVSSLKMAALKDKAKKLVNFPDLRKLLTFVTGGITRFKVIESRMRSKYDSAAVTRWAEGYEAFFAGLVESKQDKNEEKSENE